MKTQLIRNMPTTTFTFHFRNTNLNICISIDATCNIEVCVSRIPSCNLVYRMLHIRTRVLVHGLQLWKCIHQIRWWRNGSQSFCLTVYTNSCSRPSLCNNKRIVKLYEFLCSESSYWYPQLSVSKNFLIFHLPIFRLHTYSHWQNKMCRNRV